jgi:hypothetical protein
MSAQFQGVDGHRAFFAVSGKGVVVNTRSLTASVVPLEETAMSRFWVDTDQHDKVSAWEDVATSAVLELSRPTGDVLVASVADRAYTLPKSASIAASAALKTKTLRGAARHVAAVLATGEQVSLRQVRALDRFFRSAEDSRGTAVWEAHGGDAASRWSASTVSKTGLVATGDPELNMLDFYNGTEDDREFLGLQDASREFTDLYKRAGDSLFTWHDGDWAPADGELPDDLTPLDDDTAVFVAASLYDFPGRPVNIRDLDPDEYDIIEAAAPGLDTELLDRTLKPEVLIAATDADGKYTPDERSANAKGQVRDKNGRFAAVGDQGVMKSGLSGTVKAVENGQIIVEAEDGNTYAVPPRDFEVGGKPPVGGDGKSKTPPLNLDAILAQPRATDTAPKAMLKHLLPPMGAAQIKRVIDDYEQFIKTERMKRAGDFKGGTGWRERRGHGGKGRENAMADDEAPEIEKLDPETSDVKPLYLAIVDRDDPQAVTDLVAMIPSTTGDATTTTFRRVGGAWVEDTKVLQDLKSPTPPPVVQLDEQMYQDVLHQVDSNPPPEEKEEPPVPAVAPAPVTASADQVVIPLWGPNSQMAALVAAGGADRNRGNAERLRRYWLYGPGAAKIRWGTGGDWYRCVRQLSKHLGPRAKGYCALRHKEATGMWTGDRRHLAMYASGSVMRRSTSDIVSLRQVITASVESAQVRSLKARVYGIGSQGASEPEAIDVQGGGRRFRIPLLIPENLESGDGRMFDVGSLSMRSLPLPLMWQPQTGDGHDGSFLVGRIDRVERTPNGLGNAVGVFDTGPYGQEAQRLVENKMLRWVSADLDRFEAEEIELADDAGDLKASKLRVKKGRLMGATLVSKPAFQECTIELEPAGELVPISDGLYVEDPLETDAQAIVAAGSIAMNIPVVPPKSWFTDPQLPQLTPLTTDDDGRVFGHIASWDMDHIGLPGSRRAPRSASNYAYFHSGVVRTDAGDDITVGQLTLAGGHADIMADAALAVKHYDDTGSAIADVHAGEDRFGIWVAGALRPGTSPEQIRSLRASAPSGDWRVINNRLELVAVCQVNVPGFPVTRAMVASGQTLALVAAGARTLAQMKSDPLAELTQRMARLEEYERRSDTARAENARSVLSDLVARRKADREQNENLAAAARARVFKALDVDGYLAEFKDFSPEKREELAKDKKALPDGSYPIENASDLRRAVQAYGRAKEADQPKVRRHIVRRARSLGKVELIPDGWTENSLNDMALTARDARETLTAAANRKRAQAAISKIKGGATE